MKHTDEETSLHFSSFADLVVLARSLNPFPYRTRPLNSSAPMVLSLKAWKSRSLPGLPRTKESSRHDDRSCKTRRGQPRRVFVYAGSIDPPFRPVWTVRIDVQIHLLDTCRGLPM